VQRIAVISPERGEEAAEDWRTAPFWLDFDGQVARIYLKRDWTAVRVEGAPVAHLELALPVWEGVGSRTWPAEGSVKEGLSGRAGDETIDVRMPKRGLRRSDRRLFIQRGERRYTFEACGLPMSGRVHLVRDHDPGAVVYLDTFCLDRHLIAQDADPVERSIVAALTATNCRERVTVNPLRRG